MANFSVYSFDIRPPDRFASGGYKNKFTLWDDGTKSYLSVDEWIKAAPGRTMTDFYQKQREIINTNFNTLFEGIQQGTLSGNPFTSTIGNVAIPQLANSKAVVHVANASNAWGSFYDVIKGKIPDKSLYGYDIETFGDTLNGNNIFGITEIGLTKLNYHNGVATTDNTFGGAFALGINQEQQKYLQGLITQVSQGEWDSLTNIEQVSLRRLSRYAGDYNSIFQERAIDMFGGEVFHMVTDLADESISAQAFQSGLNNLTKLGKEQDTTQVFSRIMNWMTDQNPDNIYFGANTDFDIDSMISYMRHINTTADNQVFSEQNIAGVNALKTRTLDTVYLSRAVAAKQGVSVPTLMSKITPRHESVGASVEELGQAFDIITGVEKHLSFEDAQQTGMILNQLGDRFFNKRLNINLKGNPTQFITKKDLDFNGLKDNLIQSLQPEDVALYIQNGTLDQTRGNEFAFVVRGRNETTQQYIIDRVEKNIDISRQFWRLDKDSTGIIDMPDGQHQYFATFKSIGDGVSQIKAHGNPEAVTYFTISDTDETAFNRRIQSLFESSQIHKLEPTDFNADGFISAESEIGSMAAKEQWFKRLDDARREYSKLFSPADVRTDKNNPFYGFKGLKDYYAIEDAIREIQKTQGHNWSLHSERFNAQNIKSELDTLKEDVINYIQEQVNQNTPQGQTPQTIDNFYDAISSSYFPAHEEAKKLLPTPYSVQTFLAMRSPLEAEKPLVSELMSIVEQKLPDTLLNDGKMSASTLNLERTALLSRMYDSSVETIYQHYHPYLRQGGPTLRTDFYAIDYRHFDKKTGKDTIQRFNSYDINKFAGSVTRFVENNSEESLEKIVKSFKKRGVLSADFSINPDADLYSNAQEMGMTIRRMYKHIADTTDADTRKNLELSYRTKRILVSQEPSAHGVITNVSGRTILGALHNVSEYDKGLQLDPDTKQWNRIGWKPVSQKEMFASNPDLFREIMDNARDIAQQYEPVTHFQTYNPLDKKVNKQSIEDFKKVFNTEIVSHMGPKEDASNVIRIFNDLLFSEQKDYSYLSHHKKDGIQALLISPHIDPEIPSYQGDSSFMLFFQQKNAGKVMEMVTSGEYDDALRNYSSIMASDISKYAAPLEIPRLHRFDVSDTDSIYTFMQGTQEKIISPRLKTYIDKSNRMVASYDGPGERIASSLYRVMGSAMEQLSEGDAEQAGKILRRGYSSVLKDSPSFASYRSIFDPAQGIVRQIQFNPNDAIHANEVILHEGLTEIFNRMALMPTNLKTNSIDGQNLTPIQQLLLAFGQRQGIDPSDFGHRYENYFNSILKTDDWQEFFHSRMVHGSLINDYYLGENLSKVVGNDPDTVKKFSNPIMTVMEQMIKNPEYEAALQESFVIGQGEVARNLISVFDSLPKVSDLTSLGSESAVSRGAYFTKKHGAFHTWAGLYGLMRPQYTQQGNSFSFDIQQAVQESDEYAKYAVGFDTITFTPKGKKQKTRRVRRRASPIGFGLNSIETDDYIFRKKINDVAAQLPSDAPKAVVKEHNMLLRGKVMNDIDVDIRFKEMYGGEYKKEGISRIQAMLKDRGITGVHISQKDLADMYTSAVADMQRQMGSLYEDKSWSSPALKSMSIFQEREAIKVQLDMGNIDYNRTKEQLTDIIDHKGGILNRDTIIGFKRNGDRIFYNGSSVQFDISNGYWESQLDELLSTGKTKLMPTGMGDIGDDKLILNGLEKSTTHSLDIDLYAKNLRITERISKNLNDKQVHDIARDIGTIVFSQFSDDSMIVGNFNVAKHGGLAALHSTWNVITARYTEQARKTGNKDYLNHLVDVMNATLEKPGFFSIKTVDGFDRIVGNTIEIEEPVKYLQKLTHAFTDEVDDVTQAFTGSVSIPDSIKKSIISLNDNIKAEVQDLVDTNSLLWLAQRQNMNEHMGKKFRIDQRVEQAFRNAGVHMNANGIVDITATEADSRLVDLIKQYSMNYSGAPEHLFTPSDKIFNAVSSQPSDTLVHDKLQSLQKQFRRETNKDLTRYNRENIDMKRTLSGMTESLHYYMNPEEMKNIKNKNIVEVSINELIEEVHRTGKTHPTAQDLEQSIFYVEGKPSSFLKKLAKRKDVDLSKDSFSIYINMGKDGSFLANPSKLNNPFRYDESASALYDGIVIPILNTKHLDETEDFIFQSSQGETVKWLNRVIDTIVTETNPTDKQLKIGNYTEEYFNILNKNTQYLSKDSDMYKVLQTWTIPTSRSLLAQDEVAPFYDDVFTHIWEYNPDTQAVTKKKIQGDGINLFQKKRALEKTFAEYGRKGELIPIAELEKYDSVVKTIKSNLDIVSTQIKNAMGDPEKWEELSGLKNLSEHLKIAQREIVEEIDEHGIPIKKIYNGLAIGISEEAFESQGIRMGDIAMQLVEDQAAYQAIKDDIDFQLRTGISKDDFVESFDVFLGETIDDRIALVEGEAKAIEVQNLRKQKFGDHLDFIKSELKKEFGSVGLNPDIIDKDVIGAVQEYLVDPLEDSFKSKTGEEFAISIRSLNKRMTDSKYRGSIPDKLHQRQQIITDIFKRSGIAQDYLKEFGMQGLLTRFPVFKGQPWIRAVLDESVSGNQFRTLNPVVSLMIHLDHDGDTAMMALLGDGTGLLRANQEMARLHKQVYQRNAVEYIPNLLSEAIVDDSMILTNDPNALNKQKASLLEIIDDVSYKKGLSDFLESYKQANPDSSLLKNVTVDNIKDNAIILEAASHSPQLSAMFDQVIPSTLTVDNALIAGTVAKIRKDYIGYISTPNYRMRESLNQLVALMKIDPNVNREQQQLVMRTISGLTAMDVGSGGLFSAIEQKTIDTKWALDTLTPIGVKRYAQGIGNIVANAGLVTPDGTKRVSYAYRDIIEAIGTKVLGTDGTKEQHATLVDILTRSSYDQYNDMLQQIANAKNTATSIAIGHLNKTTDELMPLAKPLQMLQPFKGLEEIALVSNEFKDVWNNLGSQGYYSSIVNSNLFKGKTEEELKTIVDSMRTLGLGEDVLDVMFARSSDIVPFKKGHVYTNPDGHYVYRGQGQFVPVTTDGVEDTTRQGFTSYDKTDFDTRGFDEAVNVNDLTKNTSVQREGHTLSAAKDLANKKSISDFERLLNNAIFNEDGRTLRDKIPDNLIPNTGAINPNLNDFDVKSMANIVTNTQNWNSARASLEESMSIYSYAVLNNQVQGDNIPKTGADLLRQLNNDIANQAYRDLSGIGDNPTPEAFKKIYDDASASGKDIATQFRKKVTSLLPKGQETFDEIQKILTRLPNTWNPTEFNNAIQSMQNNLYILPNELKSLDAIHDTMQSDFDILKKRGVEDSILKPMEDFLNDKSVHAKAIRDNIPVKNLDTIVGGQKAIYNMVTENGLILNDKTKNYIKGAFQWDLAPDRLGESLVGFGTYMGQRFDTLSPVDIKAIMEEAAVDSALSKRIAQEAMAGELPTITGAYRYAADETIARLKNFQPTTLDSSWTKMNLQNHMESDILKNIRTQQGSITQTVINSSNNSTKIPPNSGQGDLVKKTLHGSFFQKIKQVKPRQVAGALSALAAIGVVNQLLHRGPKTPMSPEKSGEKYPATKQEKQKAPPSNTLGNRTIYHDAPSGIDFKVSAQTKRQLDYNGYANITHRAGGGNARVNIYSNMDGVSDNWLSNKFAELAE